MADHITNATALAREIADVFHMLGVSADDAADPEVIDNRNWALADQIVRATRLGEGRLSAAEAARFERPGWAHVPGEITRAAVVAVLREREEVMDDADVHAAH